MSQLLFGAENLLSEEQVIFILSCIPLHSICLGEEMLVKK